jgi:membrane protein required for colicin V production
VNWLDILIAIVLLTSMISSAAQGITRELVSLAALVLGIVCGLWWYPQVGQYLEPHAASKGVAGFVAFFFIMFACLALGWLVSRILRVIIKAGGLDWADRMMGAAFGLVRGVLASAAVVLAIVSFLHGPGATQAVAQSKLAPAVLYGARGLAAVAPQPLRDAFDRGFQRIREAWRGQGDRV